MTDQPEQFSPIDVRAVMGRGASDSFVTVKVPNKGQFDSTLRSVHGGLTRSDKYCNLPSAYAIAVDGGEASIDCSATSVEHAAVWVPRRGEWVGIRVKRITVYEGQWQGFDERVECDGPYTLSEDWAEKIWNVFKLAKPARPREIFFTDPSEF